MRYCRVSPHGLVDQNVLVVAVLEAAALAVGTVAGACPVDAGLCSEVGRGPLLLELVEAVRELALVAVVAMARGGEGLAELRLVKAPVDLGLPGRVVEQLQVLERQGQRARVQAGQQRRRRNRDATAAAAAAAAARGQTSCRPAAAAPAAPKVRLIKRVVVVQDRVDVVLLELPRSARLSRRVRVRVQARARRLPAEHRAR